MIASRSHRRLILWDIDHTLIETRGLGSELYANAFCTATGTPMVHKAEVTGQTEPSILLATLRLHGIAGDEPHLSRYEKALPAEYDRHRAELAERGQVLPGAQQTLAALARRPELVQSVLTGNLREVARIKLEVFDLDRYVDLEAGAYGDDDTDRPKLVAIAQHRASVKYGTVFGPGNTIVIGDSSHDINTGLRGGAHAVGVAAGGESVEQLLGAGAVVVWPDLTDAAAIEAFLLSSLT
ncbi:HAD family hydrolase [Dactylosporangium matsuzakiense]|uniref:Haloacid dehalogenase n=1 Tax=Dactylosporangium matsuzakiense TaxID=53360 RepID=A0A9W6KU43_9ACTN|nr:haloacid dehalogenase-like hydrolase [Dactylosporangium matsuzakiense]GLL07230.1 haloacid dehalogenase [Dactylosporangium matsuzakiense]